ncbi:hypothetical protein ZIOFF_017046 [Zingiber officinale]|uniref:Deoxyuridine 5'-triphosphate nucleotidohydrolase n=1 Tax=Zingiber officinale TaxID=94328 RepID=A0A8J5L9Z9_ZINOF|nr:hypothetical protein ZIOFF_017046 [Zingiber officinale]
MTVCPAYGPFYLNKTLTLKMNDVIPPYEKEERMIQELLDYTNYLRSISEKRVPAVSQDEDLYLKVKRLTETTKLPIRRTPEAVGYDIFLDEEVHVMPHQQSLVKTGISLECSNGYYARIAARSGAAYRLNFLINAGVIDFDFRGEAGLSSSLLEKVPDLPFGIYSAFGPGLFLVVDPKDPIPLIVALKSCTSMTDKDPHLEILLEDNLLAPLRVLKEDYTWILPWVSSCSNNESVPICAASSLGSILA